MMGELPIYHAYGSPAPSELIRLRRQSRAEEVSGIPGAHLDHTYFERGLGGCLPDMFLREGVLESLRKAAFSLPPGFGLWLFDAFRTTECQTSLFREIFEEIQEKNPSWSVERITAETRRFVANPEEKSRFAVSPHNSGGAVDLTLHKNGVRVAMGTGFDEVTAASETDFFEGPYRMGCGYTQSEWEEIRGNRRILFHAMISAGFVNYRHEWWHYDLGDCIWADECGTQWIYDSMELEVRQKCVAFTACEH